MKYWPVLSIAVASLLLGAIWYMSPLALGFAPWPSDPGRRKLALNLYLASYWVGLPLLGVGQIAAIVAKLKQWPRAAAMLSAVSFGTVAICIAAFLVAKG